MKNLNLIAVTLTLIASSTVSLAQEQPESILDILSPELDQETAETAQERLSPEEVIRTRLRVQALPFSNFILQGRYQEDRTNSEGKSQSNILSGRLSDEGFHINTREASNAGATLDRLSARAEELDLSVEGFEVDKVRFNREYSLYFDLDTREEVESTVRRRSAAFGGYYNPVNASLGVRTPSENENGTPKPLTASFRAGAGGGVTANYAKVQDREFALMLGLLARAHFGGSANLNLNALEESDGISGTLLRLARHAADDLTAEIDAETMKILGITFNDSGSKLPINGDQMLTVYTRKSINEQIDLGYQYLHERAPIRLGQLEGQNLSTHGVYANYRHGGKEYMGRIFYDTNSRQIGIGGSIPVGRSGF